MLRMLCRLLLRKEGKDANWIYWLMEGVRERGYKNKDVSLYLRWVKDVRKIQEEADENGQGGEVGGYIQANELLFGFPFGYVQPTIL